MEFLELKYRLLSLLVLAESKLKSWIIKYGRRESVELLLQSYIVSLPGAFREMRGPLRLAFNTYPLIWHWYFNLEFKHEGASVLNEFDMFLSFPQQSEICTCILWKYRRFHCMNHTEPLRLTLLLKKKVFVLYIPMTVNASSPWKQS